MITKQMILKLMMVSALCMPVAGCAVGLWRYQKYGEEIKKKLEEECRLAQEKGGIASLYHKRVRTRVFKRTIGLPICIGLFLAMAILGILFSMV